MTIISQWLAISVSLVLCLGLRSAPSVGTYFADVATLRQGTQAGDIAGPGNFFDLQNVQVLKGPQGH